MKKTPTRLSFFLSFACTAAAFLPGAAAEAQEVQQLWTDSCARCHGADGKGSTKMGRKLKIKDLTSPRLQARLSTDRIAEAIAEGSRDNDGNERMPSFREKLTEEQRSSLAAYVKTLSSGGE